MHTCGDLIASVPFFEDAEEGFTTSVVTLLRPTVRRQHPPRTHACMPRRVAARLRLRMPCQHICTLLMSPGACMHDSVCACCGD